MPRLAPNVYGKLSKTAQTRTNWGSKAKLVSNWGSHRVNAFLIEFSKPTRYTDWSDAHSENLCIVEKGKGRLEFHGKPHQLRKGFAFKVFPGQSPTIIPKGRLTITSIQLPTKSKIRRQLQVVNVQNVPGMVFEYEAIGKQAITCNYKNGLGLVHFTLPLDRFPMHFHRISARFFRPEAGTGYIQIEKQRYELNPDAYLIFDKDKIHTIGPTRGSVFKFFGVHIPWVNPKIDEAHPGGSHAFVKYVEHAPKRKRWKTKKQLEKAAKR